LCVELAEQRIPFKRQKELIIRSRIFFGSFAFIRGKKEEIEYAQRWAQPTLWSAEPSFPGFSAPFQKSRTHVQPVT